MSTMIGGASEFKVFAPHAAVVEILGDFTGWHDHPAEMVRGEGGWWTLRLTITPGDYDFQYRIDGHHWQPDYAAHGVRRARDGNWVSRLYIPAVALPASRLHAAAA